jgi:hypothetical protein
VGSNIIEFTDGTGEDFGQEKNAYGELVTEMNRLKTVPVPVDGKKPPDT